MPSAASSPDLLRFLEELVTERREILAATLPCITVIDRRVLCNGRMLDLTRRPMTLRVFQAFCDAPEPELSREDVMSIVYPSWRPTSHSDRFAASLIANTVKLLSRCRQHAQAAFSDGSCAGLQWFPYDPEKRVWRLYAVTPDYPRAST